MVAELVLTVVLLQEELNAAKIFNVASKDVF